MIINTEYRDEDSNRNHKIFARALYFLVQRAYLQG